MAFSSGNSSGPMAEINVTPLVDVMLVLLIIFMITAPLMSHKVKVELPAANLDKRPDQAPPVPPITLTVKEDGSVFWNDEAINRNQLESQFSVAAQQTPQPQLNVRGDKTTKYQVLRELVDMAQKQGMRKVGFVATKEK
ncbi:biopolymer transport protein exbD1 [Lysobacter xinjiangensis]|uniref:Biopolymer transport protein exbD1 n=1 Tax=Cognatilysobacter xinjiangensis TaxID=546892 RepID=A0ABQ3C656_9GAMM|nr:biopolymer transporter ExbD [Lysobacter xinjiangensis]GGZ68612.1 biopolymer transport protein exbD1 [Lysobacter xinjiangensis]